MRSCGKLNTDRTEFPSAVFTKRFRIWPGIRAVIYSLEIKQFSQTHSDADGCNFWRCIVISHLAYNLVFVDWKPVI